MRCYVCRGLGGGQPALLQAESLPERLRSMQSSLMAKSSAASAASDAQLHPGGHDSAHQPLTVPSYRFPI